MTGAVGELLGARDWPGLASLFASRQPQGAAEFEARALLALQGGSAPVDWARVVADLQNACALAPADARLRANLAQALLDAGRPAEAYEQARLAYERDAEMPAVLERLALTEAAMQRWDKALAALSRLKAVDLAARTSPAAERLAAQLATGWWKPLPAAAVSLQRPGPRHAPFLEATFAAPEFMRHFHRFQPQGVQAVRQFIDGASAAPWRSRRIDWIIEDESGATLGLAALVDIDWVNLRAELLVGFPQAPGASTALQVTIAVLDFAFTKLKLSKLVSYVYADNPGAQQNTLHLGFVQEGLLRSHVRAEGGRLDLFVNGLLREDWDASRFLTRLRRRWTP